jgi:lipopolysaccharide export system protein LptC
MSDNLHSRLVGFLKIVLPLVALALLSTLFLFSRTIDPEAAIPYAEVDIAERVREPRVTAPAWAGVTSDGAALTVTAQDVRPSGTAGGAMARGVHAVLDMRGGGQVDLRAESGVLDEEAQLLSVRGDVVLTATTGWRVETQALAAALDRTRLESPAAVTARGPAGDLAAGSMLLSPASAAGDYAMVFNGGVRLIYVPPQPTAGTP